MSYNPDWGEESFTMKFDGLVAQTDRGLGFKDPDGGEELKWLPRSALLNEDDLEEHLEKHPDGDVEVEVEMKAWLAVKEDWAEKDDFY
jgi:hypothetical protein